MKEMIHSTWFTKQKTLLKAFLCTLNMTKQGCSQAESILNNKSIIISPDLQSVPIVWKNEEHNR